jgi:hypothetical protein
MGGADLSRKQSPRLQRDLTGAWTWREALGASSEIPL